MRQLNGCETQQISGGITIEQGLFLTLGACALTGYGVTAYFTDDVTSQALGAFYGAFLFVVALQALTERR